MSEMNMAEALLLNDRRNDDFMGNGSWVWIFMMFFLFGFGGNGFGYGRGNCCEDLATKAAVSEGFNFNQIDNGIRSLQNGLCSTTYELNSAIKDCCCTTNRNIDSVKYEMSKGFCDVITASNLNTRDILQNQNAGVQKILDYLCNNEKQELRDKIQTLETSGIIQAQTQNLVNTLRPCPIPAYLSCSPYQTYGFGNGNCGCGGCGVFNGYGF